MKVTAYKITGTNLLKDTCEATMHNQVESKMTPLTIYNCEHSPIRSQMFVVKMEGIPSYVSVHLVRHKIGVEHFIQTHRDDRIPHYDEEYGSSDTYKGCTSQYFNDVFTYRDGKLFWKESRANNKIKAGDEAGCKTSFDRWQINIDNKSFFRHIIVFMMHYGYKPPTVDHIDRNTLNDVIENLRPATKKENSRNTFYQNETGYKGVHIRKNVGVDTFYALIQTEGLSKNLGTFSTPEEAAIAYDKEAVRLFGRFAKLNFPNTQMVERNTPVNHTMILNAQTLMGMARKRLCYKASDKTREVFNLIVDAIARVDEDLPKFLEPECIYRGGYCHEPKMCGKVEGVKWVSPKSREFKRYGV